MAQTQRISGVATNVQTKNGVTTVRYHSTDVVTFDDNTIKLDTGGWRSVTTKLRMNQASNQFDLGYGVWQEKGEWYVEHKGKTYTFENETLELKRQEGATYETGEGAQAFEQFHR